MCSSLLQPWITLADMSRDLPRVQVSEAELAISDGEGGDHNRASSTCDGVLQAEMIDRQHEQDEVGGRLALNRRSKGATDQLTVFIFQVVERLSVYVRPLPTTHIIRDAAKTCGTLSLNKHL